MRVYLVFGKILNFGKTIFKLFLTVFFSKLKLIIVSFKT